MEKGSNLAARPSAMVTPAAPAALLTAFHRSVEHAQPHFTRKDERRDGSIHTLSRIDRIFVNLPVAELRDFQCHFHTIGSIGEHSVPSDHTPVRLTIESLRAKQQDHPAIRRWLVQHPIFISALHEEHGNLIYDVDSYIALEQFKEVAFRARTKARQALLSCTPTTPGLLLSAVSMLIYLIELTFERCATLLKASRVLTFVVTRKSC